MQIKEVKIAGFQCENLKITLTYQVSKTEKRYIIRKNRKIIWKYYEQNEITVRNALWNTIFSELKQTRIKI